jgi:hypothetical protein
MGKPRQRLKRRVRLSIPAGIEKVIYRAAIDPGFRQILLADRKRAIESHGPRLTDVEARVLESIPAERLEHIIERIEPRRHGKRAFMRSIATAVVTLATGTATVSCEQATPLGVDPDVPIDMPPADVVGDTADLPPDIPDVTDEDVEVDLEFPDGVEGIMPDAPDDVPLDEEDAEEDVEEED